LDNKVFVTVEYSLVSSSRIDFLYFRKKYRKILFRKVITVYRARHSNHLNKICKKKYGFFEW